jgi:hypothetical protein
VDSERTHEDVAIAPLFNPGGLKGDLRVLLDVEKIGAAQIGIPLVVPGVDTGGFNRTF